MLDGVETIYKMPIKQVTYNSPIGNFDRLLDENKTVTSKKSLQICKGQALTLVGDIAASNHNGENKSRNIYL